MEESLKFNSQVCTDINQSKKLLELGLKPETADMVLFKTYDLPQYPFDYTFNQDPSSLNKIRYIPTIKSEQPFVQDGNIPAWSLHRLLCMLDYDNADTFNIMPNLAYEDVIATISLRVGCGAFNKEYLNE